ncbi:hypothetical protein RZG19_004743 [Citrobacter freundii]|uniref:Uncharacterized protein n=2 Tax=Enterobacteriaceae TaxID=543 RepID=A0AAN4D0P6_CITFR|nr:MULTISPECIES: hypothetical protein [Enterobacteriaceae]EAB7503656.1 hypothetical protein [Salmonella enterica subsp. enterica]EAN2617722.1 hypothetical protein [Salmonella enterica]EBQ9892697.1 hypothetical protein [Salmonella enterica subsp. enterica serovar Hvittingfoss]EBS2857827.1 hypothetical protein [Salmonella enterica subsp. enterica serovar Richmond]EBS4510159.1 hypothetical protein [Salmonella enterica subsp. enterica serovar Adamstua]EBV5419020.1 hypothetical protein [Salmonella
MRYWILVVLLNGLFALVMHFAAPEMFGSTEYYVGAGICALIAMVITWRDPPGMLDNVLLFLLKWGIVASGLAFFIWGIGYKLEFWGEHNPDVVFSSAFDTILPNLAVLSGVLILVSGWVYWRRR